MKEEQGKNKYRKQYRKKAKKQKERGKEKVKKEKWQKGKYYTRQRIERRG